MELSLTPSIDAVTAAASASAANTPDDLRVSITNAAGPSAYPISSYTYILVYKNQKDAAKGKALVDFLWWGIHDGEGFAKDLQYAPLPADIVKRAEAKINSINANGASSQVGTQEARMSCLRSPKTTNSSLSDTNLAWRRSALADRKHGRCCFSCADVARRVSSWSGSSWRW